MFNRVVFATVALFTVVGSVQLHAQTLGRVESTESNSGDYYFYVQPGERTIQVNMIGAVRSPGLYEIGTDVSLGQLLALSGGPIINSRQKRNKRDTQIRVIRGGAVTYNVNIEESETPYVNFSGLQEGDIVRVDVVERTPFGWRDGLQILTAAASFVLIVDRVQN